MLWSVGILAAAVVVGLAGVAVYVARTWDRVYDAPLPDVSSSRDPAVLARGEYLVYGPAHCVECHGGTDALQKLSEGVLVPLSGGLRLAMGPLGAVYSSNLTPDPQTGIGRYSDAQIARMMRWAVRPDGRATVEPMMPYGNMSEDDLVAVISYLRAQPPVSNGVPPNEWTMMGKVVKSFVGVMKPRSAINPPPSAPPPGGDEGAGRISRPICNQLRRLPYAPRPEHIRRDRSRFLRRVRDGAGADPRRRSDRLVQNAEPHAGRWQRAHEVPGQRTRSSHAFKRGGRQHAGSFMPWEAYARMTTDDISALYEYLHSLPPIDGPVGEPTFKKEG